MNREGMIGDAEVGVMMMVIMMMMCGSGYDSGEDCAAVGRGEDKYEG